MQGAVVFNIGGLTTSCPGGVGAVSVSFREFSLQWELLWFC